MSFEGTILLCAGITTVSVLFLFWLLTSDEYRSWGLCIGLAVLAGLYFWPNLYTPQQLESKFAVLAVAMPLGLMGILSAIVGFLNIAVGWVHRIRRRHHLRG